MGFYLLTIVLISLLQAENPFNQGVCREIASEISSLQSTTGFSACIRSNPLSNPPGMTVPC